MTFISPSTRYRTRFVCLGTPLATCTLPLGVLYLLTYLLGEPTEREQPDERALSLTPSPLRALAPGWPMEGQAGTANAPAPPRRSLRDCLWIIENPERVSEYSVIVLT